MLLVDFRVFLPCFRIIIVQLFLFHIIMSVAIGKKLRSLRKKKGWSQEQTAVYLCISQSAYARMEKGGSNSWATSLTKICEVFEITPEELFKQESVLNINNSNDSQKPMDISNACFFYEMSKKLMQQYEDRLKEKDEIIAALIKERNQGK